MGIYDRDYYRQDPANTRSRPSSRPQTSTDYHDVSVRSGRRLFGGKTIATLILAGLAALLYFSKDVRHVAWDWVETPATAVAEWASDTFHNLTADGPLIDPTSHVTTGHRLERAFSKIDRIEATNNVEIDRDNLRAAFAELNERLEAQIGTNVEWQLPVLAVAGGNIYYDPYLKARANSADDRLGEIAMYREMFQYPNDHIVAWEKENKYAGPTIAINGDIMANYARSLTDTDCILIRGKVETVAGTFNQGNFIVETKPIVGIVVLENVRLVIGDQEIEIGKHR